MASATLNLLISLKDDASGALEKVSGAMGGLATIAGGAALAGVVGLGAALVGGAADAREAAKITAQTQAVITSTGAAAGVTAQQVADYAASLSAASGASLFGDDQIQQSSNLLLTFTNIKDGALQAATAMSVDMAQALGGAPKDAAMQLGKALNDPIAGVGALSRVGVTFTEEQKETIKTMQEAGDTAGAQAVILAELSKEFGGSAAAAAAADGGIAQFKDRLGEAAETAGGAFLPLLDSISALLNDTVAPAVEAAAAGFAAFLADNQPAIEAFSAVLVDQLGAAVTAIIAAWQGLQPQIQTAVAAFMALLPVVQPLIDMIGANLQPALVAIAGVLGGVIVVAIATAVASFLAAAAPILALVAVAGLLFAAWQSNFGGIQQIVATVMAQVQAIISTVLAAVVAFWQANGAQIMAQAQTAFASILQIISGVMQIIGTVVSAALAGVLAFWQQNGAAIQGYVTGLWAVVSNLFQAGLALINGIVQTVLALIRGDWEGAKTAIAGTVEAMWSSLKQAFEGGKLALTNAVTLLIAAVKQAFGGLASEAVTIGSNIIDGIKQGIQSGVSALTSAVTGAATSALNAAKAALGIKSPSKVFADGVGTPISEGIAEGITAGSGDVNASLMAFMDDFGNYSTVFGEAFQALPVNVREAVQAIHQELGESGVGAFQNYVNKALQSGDTLNEWLGHLPVSVQSAVEQIGQELTGTSETADIGSNIVEGIISGVEASSHGMMTALEQLARDALNAAQAALDIHSPSAVMHRQVGVPIAQGMADGILAGISYVHSAMQTLSEATVKELTDLAAKAQAAIQNAIKDGVAGAAGYARARAGSERALFGLLPDPKQAQAAADKLMDIDAQMARLRVTAAQNDDPNKRADAAEKLIKLEQERVTVAQNLATIQAQNAQLAAIQAAAVAAERAAISESLKYGVDLQDEYYKLRASQIMELAALHQDMATATTEAERAALAEQIRIIEKAQARERELFELQAQNKADTTAALVDQLRALLAKLNITLPPGTIPGFASGTSYAPGGLALVGERGPELVSLPRGSQVYTASQSRGMMGGTQQTISIVINAAPGMNEQRIAAAVGRELGRQADSRRRMR